MNAKDILDKILNKIDGAYSPDTIRAYRVDFIEFIEFCDARNQCALPGSPQILAEFIEMLTQKKRRSASIRRSIAGIASIHNFTGYSDPTKHVDVKLALRRMHRQIGRYSHQAYGINKPMLEKMISATGNDLRGIRDRALLRIAYDTMCRRSELISIRIEDVRSFYTDDTESKSMTAIFLRRSKTDQEAYGKWLRVTDSTAQAINEWLEASNLLEGLLLRGVWRGDHLTEKLVPGQISRIFKRVAKLANLQASVVKHISGHSTRIGAAQDLVLSGASLPQIMQKGRWSKPDTVMRYVENLGSPI